MTPRRLVHELLDTSLEWEEASADPTRNAKVVVKIGEEEYPLKTVWWRGDDKLVMEVRDEQKTT